MTKSCSFDERVDFWREMVLRLFADVDISAKPASNFFGKMKSQHCNALRLTDANAAGQIVNRRHRYTRSEYEDRYFAILMLEGTQFMEQDGNEVLLKPGDFALYDATRPHHLTFPADWREVIVSVPRIALNQRVTGLEKRMATRIQTDTGVGRVLRGFFEGMTSQIGTFNAIEMERLAETATNLIALSLGTIQPADATLSRTRNLALIRVKIFINEHLGDPNLNTQMVVQAMMLSSRYINKLFEDEGSSLMRYILRRRLERCSADLLDPANTVMRISDVALRWGFNNLSHFSRAFRDHYGSCPRTLRYEGAEALLAVVKGEFTAQ
ncbi:helix-turn-helix domain-containing protein [Glaciimonas sp. PCH181]|uniref:AraC-like ligand-binding domain-containing protein n=1 Tax=Glaciimonas sp. PCH181 TaxID=2133943 RepID=UPI00191BD885|nr:helix-turn-helix domain-containing protein [Glaciimonas sp. PCH181]